VSPDHTHADRMGLTRRKAPSTRHVLDLPPPYQRLLEAAELIFLLAGEKLAEVPGGARGAVASGRDQDHQVV
jgi:hypothetical protein